jgi:hypothetical protein
MATTASPSGAPCWRRYARTRSRQVASGASPLDLAIVRSIYYEYYLPWKSIAPDGNESYRQHLDRLYASIKASLKRSKSVVVNGHKTLLRAPEPRRPLTVHRVVMFGLQASVVTVLLTASMLGLRQAFGLSNASFVTIFVLALMMAFKLLEMAEERWRKVNGSELLPLVRAGVRFVDGVQAKPKNAAGEVKENAA